MKKLKSLFNVAKLWVKNGFLLYISSWKRSFDFVGAPREGEYANFVKVSLGILSALLVCFWGVETPLHLSPFSGGCSCASWGGDCFFVLCGYGIIPICRDCCQAFQTI